MLNQTFNEFLKETLSIEDQVDLGLIRNPIYDNHQVVNEIKESLNHYDDETQEQLGITYAGCLTAEDEPTNAELLRALDIDDLSKVKEELIPETKRSNFWYVDKRRNEHDGYTLYHLANGQDRIVTDDEMANNPWFAEKRLMSDAWEDGDFDTYNQIKNAKAMKRFQTFNSTNTINTVEQCFIKVGSKLYGDVINLPLSILKKEPKQILSYLDMFNPLLRQLTKLNTKIKLINLNKKTMAIL